VNKSRYLTQSIIEDLKTKMVFLGGPRQVGKTTLALSLLEPPNTSHPCYLNWDDLGSKAAIRNGELPAGPLVIYDEVHKYRNWRSLLKGLYDKHRQSKQFLVTGSARLDHYRRGGDSLLGRYRYLRLHPFSAPELGLQAADEIEHLLEFGGFPEAYLSKDKKVLRRWHNERLYRLVNDDIRSLENLRDYNGIELLAETLQSRVGSPLSVNALAQDLEYNFRTIENWIQILEQTYFCYRILPYGPPKIKAVKKERKLFLWDWSSCTEVGSRFENFVASHLLKYCHFIEDTQGWKMELRFLRDATGREVDFIVLKNKKPLFAVECKCGEKSLSPSIHYFKERTNIPMFYQVHLGSRDYQSEARTRVLPFLTFCSEVHLC
jgi:uncharacterized protein